MISSILSSELYYDWCVTAILENILPACGVINLFHLHIKRKLKYFKMTRGKEKLKNNLFHNLTSSFSPDLNN
jgi:hypothetical protein